MDSDTLHCSSFSSIPKQTTFVSPLFQIYLTSVMNIDLLPPAFRAPKSSVPNTVSRLRLAVAKVVFSSPDRSSTAVQQDSAHTD
jgi:hypothetical protein